VRCSVECVFKFVESNVARRLPAIGALETGRPISFCPSVNGAPMSTTSPLIAMAAPKFPVTEKSGIQLSGLSHVGPATPRLDIDAEKVVERE
jgi:hypothetical protein